MRRAPGAGAVIRLCLASLAILIPSVCFSADEVPMQRLNDFAKKMIEESKDAVGYPVNQNVDMTDFYRWYVDSGLCGIAMNNVGNPRNPSIYSMNTHEFENEVVDFFAPLYGFAPTEAWGIVTHSGTDGNAHGMYFGVKYLQAKAKMLPVVYVSEDAHYSIHKLADLQNLELKLIPADLMGHMLIPEFEKALDPTRPALVVVAMGTTFKGAIDDQAAIDEVLRRKKPVAVYRHMDAALFGGFLPFTDSHEVIDRKKVYFDSIAVSGHKFFGFDEPLGIFITTNEVLQNQNPFRVAYLNEAVPTITCSRSALGALKFWWKVKKTGLQGFKEQAVRILANAQYLSSKMEEIRWPHWMNPHSNTVFFKRPDSAIMTKWDLAPEEDPRLGGLLAHDIVMQHETKEKIDLFIADLKKSMEAEGK
ncbi:MAG: aminotransferase class V-fold PLP-dependent enzyme [Acidobacteriota bacterium]